MSHEPESSPPPPTPRAYSSPAGDSPVMTFMSAVLFLYIGFVAGLQGISESALYNGSVTALTWGARFVGVGLVVIGLLSIARIAAVAYVDVLVSFVAAAGCLVVGLIWVAFGDMQGFLVLLFGVLNGSALHAAWVRVRWLRDAGRAPEQ